MAFILCNPSSKEFLDFIDCDCTRLVNIKQVEDLSKPFLIDYCRWIEMSNQKLRVIYGAVVVEVQFLEESFSLDLCSRIVALIIVLVSL